VGRKLCTEINNSLELIFFCLIAIFFFAAPPVAPFDDEPEFFTIIPICGFFEFREEFFELLGETVPVNFKNKNDRGPFMGLLVDKENQCMHFAARVPRRAH